MVSSRRHQSRRGAWSELGADTLHPHPFDPFSSPCLSRYPTPRSRRSFSAIVEHVYHSCWYAVGATHPNALHAHPPGAYRLTLNAGERVIADTSPTYRCSSRIWSASQVWPRALTPKDVVCVLLNEILRVIRASLHRHKPRKKIKARGDATWSSGDVLGSTGESLRPARMMALYILDAIDAAARVTHAGVSPTHRPWRPA